MSLSCRGTVEAVLVVSSLVSSPRHLSGTALQAMPVFIVARGPILFCHVPSAS